MLAVEAEAEDTGRSAPLLPKPQVLSRTTRSSWGKCCKTDSVHTLVVLESKKKVMLINSSGVGFTCDFFVLYFLYKKLTVDYGSEAHLF